MTDDADNHDRLLLIVEDDDSFSATLRRSFERRGYTVVSAANPDQMADVLKVHRPGYAVVDLKLGGASGLTCVEALHAFDPAMNIVVLTGFASIATAVEAIKLGARVTIWPSPPAPTTSRPHSPAPMATPKRRWAPGRPRSRPWSGSESTRPWSRPTSTFPRPRAGWECIAAPWPGSWKSAA